MHVKFFSSFLVLRVGFLIRTAGRRIHGQCRRLQSCPLRLRPPRSCMSFPVLCPVPHWPFPVVSVGVMRENALLLSQHGVISVPQAMELGYTRRRIQYTVGTGRWVRVHQGVYRIAATPETPHARIIAASLATRGVASHRSAAWLFGLVDHLPNPVEVTILWSRRSRRNEIHLYRTRSVETCKVSGVIATPPARTVLDLAGTLDVHSLEEVLDRSLALGLVSLARISNALNSRRCETLSGSRHLRQLVAERNLRIPESVLESKFLRLIRHAGLPIPEVQYQLCGYRLDFAYPDQQVGIEIDGLRTHLGRTRWENDMKRHNRIEAQGWRLLRFGSARLTQDRSAVAFEVGHALGLTPARWRSVSRK